MNEKSQVLVVGAGPTGLTLALYLAKHGINVRIIEQSIDAHGGARGTAISPRTQELLTIMGVADDIFEIDTGPLKMTVYGNDGKTIEKAFDWSEAAPESPTTPFRNIASLAQAQLEAILRRHLKKFGCEVEVGKQLVDFTQDDEKVTAKVSVVANNTEAVIECDYLIAAEGAKGRSRRLLGVSFLGETRESERLWTANVQIPGFKREYWHRWGDFASVMMALKPLYPAPLFQLQALGPALPKDIPTDLMGIQQFFDSISHRTDVKMEKVEYISEWRSNIRMTDKFSVGRVFLAGDTAHCHSPSGGQGTNTAMQDAFNLAWKLVLVLRQKASTSLLDSYEVERMPVVAEMLNLSTALHEKAFRHGQEIEVEKQEDGVQPDPMLRSNKLLQLGVNYRWSNIILDERKAKKGTTEKNPYGTLDLQVSAGDRAPFIGGLVTGEETTDLFTLLREASSHLVLVFPSSKSSIGIEGIGPIQKLIDAGLVDVYAIIDEPSRPASLHGLKYLLDVDRGARNAYAADNRTAYVTIRPDGIIGAYTFGIEGIAEYFRHLGVMI